MAVRWNHCGAIKKSAGRVKGVGTGVVPQWCHRKHRCSGICQKAFNSGLLIATQLETGVYKSGLRNPAIELENGELGNWGIEELRN
jgi:hypothetical protein